MTEPSEEQRAVCDCYPCKVAAETKRLETELQQALDYIYSQRNLKAECAKLREFIQEYVSCECPREAVVECCDRCLILKGDQAEGKDG
jgi:phage host-nuclease inhibitor protein Gam